MKPARFREGRRRLGLSTAQLGRQFESDARTVRRWEWEGTKIIDGKHVPNRVKGPAAVLMKWIAFDQPPWFPPVGRFGRGGRPKSDE